MGVQWPVPRRLGWKLNHSGVASKICTQVRIVTDPSLRGIHGVKRGFFHLAGPLWLSSERRVLEEERSELSFASSSRQAVAWLEPRPAPAPSSSPATELIPFMSDVCTLAQPRKLCLVGLTGTKVWWLPETTGIETQSAWAKVVSQGDAKLLSHCSPAQRRCRMVQTTRTFFTVYCRVITCAWLSRSQPLVYPLMPATPLHKPPPNQDWLFAPGCSISAAYEE